CAVYLSEVLIRCLKSEPPHRSIDWDRCYNGCTQKLIVRRCRLTPSLRPNRPKLTLDKGAGFAPNVPRHLRDSLFLERVADIHREIFECAGIGFRRLRGRDYPSPACVLGIAL